MQEILNDKKDDYYKLKSVENPTVVQAADLAELQRVIRSMTKEVDRLHNSMQEVILKEKGIDKGLSSGNNIHITQNYVNVFQGHLKGFLDEVVPYLLMTVFKDNQDLGREVVTYISNSMDKHLSPAFEESKLLTPSN